MSRLNLIVCSAAAVLLMGAAVFGEAGDGAKKAKGITYYCPVAGMPEVKTCGCPGGYCPRRPRLEITADYKGTKIELCCSNCVSIFKKEPAKFAAIANHQLVATKKAQQVKCPMCGNDLGFTPGLEVAGIYVALWSHECNANLKKLSPTERVQRVFGDEGFSRGFVMDKQNKK